MAARVVARVGMLVLGGLLLAGCTGSPSPRAAPTLDPLTSSAPSAAPVTPGSAKDQPSSDLVIWADSDLVAALRPYAQRFAAAHDVSVTVQPEDDSREEVLAALGTTEGPDVFVGSHAWVGTLADHHAIAPVGLSAAERGRFAPVSLEAVRYQDRSWGVPFAIENIALVRNLALAPDPPTSFEQMVRTGQRLKASGRTSEVLLQESGLTGDAMYAYPYLSAYGGGIFAKKPNGEYDGHRLRVSSPGSVRGGERLGALGRAGVLSTSVDKGNSDALFDSGAAPWFITGPWSLQKARAAGVRYAVSALPSFEGGATPRPLLDVSTFFMSSHAQVPALARAFLTECVAGTDVQVALARRTHLPPAWMPAYREVAAKDADVRAWFEAGRDGDPVPNVPQMDDVWGPLGQASADIIAGRPAAQSLLRADLQIRGALP